ncbi:hypothetical protein TNCV_2344371 [Trichonephila clavipes]|nr:hypothetical protein TNCV_2344371 [Trichonephila clavipes]
MLPVLGKKAVLEWCMKEGLLGSSYVCPKCGKSMELREKTGRETVLASSFYSQYGLPTISGLPLHDGKRRYRPEKPITDSPKGLSQLVAIYFVVFQCNPWLSLFR